MTRDDDELGEVRLCRFCQEWWPNDREFFAEGRTACRACHTEHRDRSIPRALWDPETLARRRIYDADRRRLQRADPAYRAHENQQRKARRAA
jgi:hypothetical protein